MDIQYIIQLKRDISEIRSIETKVLELKKNPHCDKLDFGFNVNSRFKGNNEVSIYLGGYKGFYGSSSVSSVFDVHCVKEFQEALIATLNELRPQILNSIADKLNLNIKHQSSEILKEINKLQSLYNEANSISEEI